MPIYSYACRACGHSFDRMLRISQRNDPQTCPSCGSGDTGRSITSFGLGSSCTLSPGGG